MAWGAYVAADPIGAAGGGAKSSGGVSPKKGYYFGSEVPCCKRPSQNLGATMDWV